MLPESVCGKIPIGALVVIAKKDSDTDGPPLVNDGKITPDLIRETPVKV